MRRRAMLTARLHRRPLVAAVACTLLLPPTLRPQARARLSGTIESGAAAVEQPLVRSGAAFYLAPSSQFTAKDVTVGADAVLATGTPTWQSFLGNVFVRSPAVANVRVIGSGQWLKTSGLLPTVHGDVGAEWRHGSPTVATIVRARVGRLRYGGEQWADADVGASAIRTHGAMVLAVDGLYSSARRPTALGEQLGVSAATGTTFTAQTLDLTPRMIWERGRLRADASVAIRAVERGVNGTRAAPQVGFTIAATRGISLFAGGGQRLPDIRAGIPSGRNALLGVRVGGTRIVTGPTPRSPNGPALRIVDNMLVLDAGTTSTRQAALRGDFTEWQPRACAPRDRRTFNCGAVPRAGIWRVAVRLDDGPWMQPANLAPAADDFGSVDGVLMTGGKP